MTDADLHHQRGGSSIRRRAEFGSAVALGLLALLVGGVVVSSFRPHPLALPAGVLVSFALIGVVAVGGSARRPRGRSVRRNRST